MLQGSFSQEDSLPPLTDSLFAEEEHPIVNASNVAESPMQRNEVHLCGCGCVRVVEGWCGCVCGACMYCVGVCISHEALGCALYACVCLYGVTCLSAIMPGCIITSLQCGYAKLQVALCVWQCSGPGLMFSRCIHTE